MVGNFCNRLHDVRTCTAELEWKLTGRERLRRCLALCVAGGSAVTAGELTIATVNNGPMIEMQTLTLKLEEANPAPQ
ncbi:hypothetical protein BCF46_3497 [Litoreibacter meonggei]|uniref:Uncharacterized protein n=1 Tax=Litoreibacter meonggei TaxID=1049199 RepID=A0A497VPG7_9RHOB|nr:hypothetical protein BCF46_3497 [Litoreibacter meonggei]